MNRLFYIVTCILLLPFWSKSQPVTPDAELDYIIEEFTLPGGRLGNNVNSIVQGPYGFLWFGSHGGLQRYDGYEFVTYKNVPSDTVGETTTLSYQYVEGLYWDKFNMLWVMTWGGGIFRFDPVKEIFKHYAHDPDDSISISHPRVTCAIEDSEGQLWFGTENGLNKFDRKTETFTRYYANPEDPKTLSSNNVKNLYVDQGGTLWAGTGFVYNNANIGSLSRYDSDNDSFVNLIVSDPKDSEIPLPSPVQGILEDSQGNFWVGTAKGLYKMDRKQETFRRMVYDPQKPFAPGAQDRPDPVVFSIIEDQKGGLWIGAIFNYNYPSHLLRYDPDTKKSQIFPVQSAAWQIYESSDGTIWIAGAGDSGKVLRIRPKAKTYDLMGGGFIFPAFYTSVLSERLAQGFSLLPEFNMAVDPSNGTIWTNFSVGNLGLENIVLSNHSQTTGETNFHMPFDQTTPIDWQAPATQIGTVGMIIDNDGSIWGSIPAENIGIYHYNPINKKLEQYLHDPNDTTTLSSNDVVTMIMDNRGEIWAATYDQGLNRLDPATGKIRQYHFNQGPWDDRDTPITIMEGLDGKIWVAGELVTKGGDFMIVVIDPATDEMQNIPIPIQYTFNVIHSMAQSPKTGKIIFTTFRNGIGSYDPATGNFNFYNTSNSAFPFDNTSAVVCDSNGVFWVSDTDIGNFVRISEEMDFYTFQESSKIGSARRSGILAPDGNVYFLSSNGGWIEINPASITPELSTDYARVRLVDLTILGEKQQVNVQNTLSKPLWMINKISLPYDAQSFGFRFTDFNFQNSNSQFQYRLYPYENEWIRSGNLPVVNYFKIPSGDYTFEVKSLRSGNWQDNTAELQVIILPPWWLTWWAYTVYGIIFIAGVFFVDRIQRRRLLEKERSRTQQKELEQAREIEKAYTELKTTQTQLIQSEKMASLGELTAGIAHEIQNPLNFVNNFSEVSGELVEEINEEIKAGNLDEVEYITTDLKQNLEKIKHHGQRASGIVKGMLEHSRTGSGIKEPTDINKLADEYLRLSYHGLRAKDKSFNADFKTDFDESLPKVKVITQDLGRVILNLINNAFYACTERSRSTGSNDYKPTVTVTTKKIGDKIEISVKDNGQGIPKEIVDKIFQPFFTTKPSGSGTGLGLSMSYDIITKGHGGELKVVTEEGEGTEFIITLPP